MFFPEYNPFEILNLKFLNRSKECLRRSHFKNNRMKQQVFDYINFLFLCQLSIALCTKKPHIHMYPMYLFAFAVRSFQWTTCTFTDRFGLVWSGLIDAYHEIQWRKLHSINETSNSFNNSTLILLIPSLKRSFR